MNEHEPAPYLANQPEAGEKTFGVFDGGGRLLYAGSREECERFIAARQLPGVFERWRAEVIAAFTPKAHQD